jgi:hypothetical protein
LGLPIDSAVTRFFVRTPGYSQEAAGYLAVRDNARNLLCLCGIGGGGGIDHQEPTAAIAD